jgi:hypothetical protein
MPQGQLDSFINFSIPIILVIIAVVFVWWKFSEPLKKFAELIRGMFASSKEKTFQTYQTTKEIVYDI